MICPLDAELVALRQVKTRVASAVNHHTWRAAKQRRSSRIARLLRLLPRAVSSSGLRRLKEPRAWVFETALSGIILKIVTTTRGRTLSDLLLPIPVVLVNRDLVDLAQLEVLTEDGTAVLLPSLECG